jgi:hypothetical protein
MDRSKLIKFLNLSTSSSDGESLSAIRKANELILENNSTWEEVFEEETYLQISNKKLNSDLTICSMNLMKERITSNELENKNIFAMSIIKLLCYILVVLIIAVILK